MGNTVGSRRNLNQVHRNVILGSILGDGCMERNGRYVRLKIGHGLEQQGYLQWKSKLLNPFCAHQPRFVEGAVHRKTGVRYSRVEVSTFSLPIFEEYWQKFYVQRKKQIPKDIDKLLTEPLAIAIWFMDDGYKRNDCNALRINTDSFAYEDQQILQKCLSKNFDVSVRIHRKGKFWNLYIPSAEASRFCELVKPYIISSMKYKISLDPVTTDPVRVR
jgi:recombination protein RecA